MPIYYFHLCDGTDVLIDPDGREIADITSIPGIAAKEARAIISQEALLGTIQLAQRIEVLDEAGEKVHRLAFREAVTFDE